MAYPKTGQEVYVSLNLSNTMLTGIGKGTITREDVSADYLKRLFAEHGEIVSAKPEQHRRLVVINVQGLRRKEGSLLPEYTDEEFAEATFSFVKYYVQSVHYDTLVEENKKLRYELDQEMEWKTRTDG